MVATDEDSGANGEITYSITSVNQEELTTTIYVAATDTGSPQSRRTQTTVTITFQSRCDLQQYYMDPTSGQLSGDLLCRVEITAPTTAVILRDQIVLMCSILKNVDVEAQFIFSSNFIGTSQPLGSNVDRTDYVMRHSALSNAGRYGCKATSAIGSLQTLNGVTVTVIGKSL